VRELKKSFFRGEYSPCVEDHHGGNRLWMEEFFARDASGPPGADDDGKSTFVGML